MQAKTSIGTNSAQTLIIVQQCSSHRQAHPSTLPLSCHSLRNPTDSLPIIRYENVLIARRTLSRFTTSNQISSMTILTSVLEQRSSYFDRNRRMHRPSSAHIHMFERPTRVRLNVLCHHFFLTKVLISRSANIHPIVVNFVILYQQKCEVILKK